MCIGWSFDQPIFANVTYRLRMRRHGPTRLFVLVGPPSTQGGVMKQNSSSRKVNEQAREVLANIMLFEVSDPRLAMVTVTGCEVSFDRSMCNVYYTASPDTYDDAAAGFEAAKGRIRSLMGRALSWRVTPELRFILDASVDEAQRIAAALADDAERNEESARNNAALEAAAAEAEDESYDAEDGE